MHGSTEHNQLSTSSKYLPDELASKTKFDIRRRTEPVDDFTLVVHMRKFLAKIQALFDDMIMLQERYDPPTPQWY